jgi:signal transduction histidine kinase/ligand-binding sensor domain-containing protein
MKRGDFGGNLEYIGAITEDREGKLWLGNPMGAWRFDPGSGAIDKFSPEDVQGKPTSVDGVAMTSDGTVWATFNEYTRGNNISALRQWIYGFKDGIWTRLGKEAVSNMGRRSFLGVDHGGGLWMPDGTPGLVRHFQGSFSRLSFFGDEIGDCAICFFCDREGNIWIGTEKKGLLAYRRRGVLMVSTKDGLPDANTWTVCPSRDGSVWIGTDGGISRWKDGQFSTFTRKEGLTRNTIRSIVEDSNGTIWVGTGRGLNFYRDRQWRQFPLPAGDGGNKIRVLCADRADGVWIGSEHGLAFVRNGELATLSEEQQLTRFDVRALLQDRTGTLWVGTYGGGLLRMSSNRIDRFSTTNGLASDLVWALHEDASGVLWLGTDRGLHRYQGGRFTVFTEREGLFDRGVNEILEDNLGNLWVSCDRGIYRVRKHELEDVANGRARKVSCVAYGTGDGLLSTEANGQKSQPAGCKTVDGRVWFATTKGVAVFDPAHLPDNPHAPKAVIEQIRADGVTVYHNGPTMGADSTVTRRSPGVDVEFGPGTLHVLEVHFTANTMIEAGLVKFEHWLEGVDPDWIEAGTRRSATYAHLRPGHYRFRVRAISKYGVVTEQAPAFSFYLKPHFYQTWIFYLGCGALLGATAFSVYRWRLGYLRRIHALEKEKALVEDRARIARDLHDSLGAQLTNLAVLANVSEHSPSAATAETRFRKLSRLAKETALELKEIIWANYPGDETLEGLAMRICQYTQQSLGAAGTRCFFDIAPEFPASPLTTQARHHLHLTAKEAINNALKHASATEFRLGIEVNGMTLRVAMEDNGRGMQEASHNGNGLRNMRRRIEELGGTFSVTGKAGGGTNVRFEVPMRSLFSVEEFGRLASSRSEPSEANDYESLHR